MIQFNMSVYRHFSQIDEQGNRRRKSGIVSSYLATRMKENGKSGRGAYCLKKVRFRPLFIDL